MIAFIVKGHFTTGHTFLAQFFSILSSYEIDLYIHFIDFVGGAHCVDMYPYDPAKYPDNTVEPADVNATIQLVKDQVANYLTLQQSLTTQTPATSPITQKPVTQGGSRSINHRLFSFS